MTTPSNIPELYSNEDWENLRMRFSSSALNDMELAILAQNAGYSWPFKGSDETPSKYLEYDFDDLSSVPGLVGKKRRIQILMDILRETLAFDDPFGDMADKVEVDGERDETYERVMKRLQLPYDYPAEFFSSDEETRKSITDKGCKTLIDIVLFGQSLTYDSTGVDDLKTFLNSLGHKDELGIGKYIPYRRGAPGLHLAEGFGLVAARLSPALQLKLLEESDVVLNSEEAMSLESADESAFESELEAAKDRIDAICEWFESDREEMIAIVAEGGELRRYFVPINDHRIELIALSLARIKFGDSKRSKGNLFSRLGSLFGR